DRRARVLPGRPSVLLRPDRAHFPPLRWPAALGQDALAEGRRLRGLVPQVRRGPRDPGIGRSQGPHAERAPARGVRVVRPPPWLDARGRYERRMHGWSDNSGDDVFTHTVRLED